MQNAAKFDGNTSKSNGSLMRCSSIGVWGYKLPPEDIAAVAAADSSLSHGNPTICAAVGAYCIAIAALVRGVDRRWCNACLC